MPETPHCHIMPPQKDPPLVAEVVKLKRNLSQGTRMGRIGSIWYAVPLRPGFRNLYQAEYTGGNLILTGCLIMCVADEDLELVQEPQVLLQWPK